jgi:hypothetical protein
MEHFFFRESTTYILPSACSARWAELSQAISPARTIPVVLRKFPTLPPGGWQSVHFSGESVLTAAQVGRANHHRHSFVRITGAGLSKTPSKSRHPYRAQTSSKSTGPVRICLLATASKNLGTISPTFLEAVAFCWGQRGRCCWGARPRAGGGQLFHQRSFYLRSLVYLILGGYV